MGFFSSTMSFQFFHQKVISFKIVLTSVVAVGTKSLQRHNGPSELYVYLQNRTDVSNWKLHAIRVNLLLRGTGGFAVEITTVLFYFSSHDIRNEEISRGVKSASFTCKRFNFAFLIDKKKIAFGHAVSRVLHQQIKKSCRNSSMNSGFFFSCFEGSY